MFDICEHIFIGKSYAVSLDDLSWKDLSVFFETLEGRFIKYHELLYITDIGRIEWDDTWDVTNIINSHYNFKIMPRDSIPAEFLSAKLLAFQERLLKSNIKPRKLRLVECNPDLPNKKELNEFAKQSESESGIDYEFRLVNYCSAAFVAVKNANVA
jgi:hypothetical protein